MSKKVFKSICRLFLIADVLLAGSSGKCSVVVSNEQMNVDEDSTAADAEVSTFTSEPGKYNKIIILERLEF